MNQTVKIAHSELVGFFSSYSLETIMAEDGLKGELKATFKRYYPLLLIEAELIKKKKWSTKEKGAEFALYLKETTSDLCQALMLATQGMYKAAYLILRSSIENFLRCIGIAEDQKVTTLGSVVDLFDLTKETNFIKSNALAKSRLSSLRGHYTALCNFVHTSTSHNMALTNLVGAFPRYLMADAKLSFVKIREVVQDICVLTAMLFKDCIHKLHYKQLDAIFDSLPGPVKRYLAS